VPEISVPAFENGGQRRIASHSEHFSAGELDNLIFMYVNVPFCVFCLIVFSVYCLYVNVY
jgi:hypothetical protein